MISKKTIDEIYAAAKVEEVIEDYVNLKRRGVNMLGLCPFHNEKTPSFTVSPAKNLYKCFGCGKGGGAVNFVMEHESFTYPEALRYLANKYNIKIEEDKQTDEAREAQLKSDSLILINEMAATYFKEQLLDSDEGRSIGLSYLKHRGLNEATINTFALGYSPKESKHFTNHATLKGYNLNSLKELGLTSTSGYDFYRERVIFPFHNLSGKVIGFGGRILKDNVKAPKYLNSPESQLYNKRKTLYGLYQARTDIRRQDACILVEGYTDVLSLHQADIKNVVASSGTSLTIEQVGLIKRFSNNVIVLYDGDAAGQKAALRGLDIFLEQGVNVTVVVLPEGQDPDSYVKELGTTGFTNYIAENGKDFILKLAHHINDNYRNDPVNKSVQIKELVKSMALIRDQIKRSLYVKECSGILDLAESTLFTEINRNIKSDIYKKQTQQRREESRPAPTQQAHVDYDPTVDHSQGIRKKVDPVDYQEKDVIRVLISAGSLWYDEDNSITIGAYLMSNLVGIIEYVKDPRYKSILEDYKRQTENGDVPDQQYWSHHQDEAIRNIAIDILSDKYTYASWSDRGLELQTQKPVEENYVKDSYQAILRFKMKKIVERINELKNIFTEQSDDSKDILLITAYQKLLKERQAIAEELKMIVIN